MHTLKHRIERSYHKKQNSEDCDEHNTLLLNQIAIMEALDKISPEQKPLDIRELSCEELLDELRERGDETQLAFELLFKKAHILGDNTEDDGKMQIIKALILTV